MPGHQEFEHHEIGQKDVGCAVRNRLTLLSVVLAGIAPEGDGRRATGLRKIFLKLLHLAVRECVHRVDDDRAGALFVRRPLAQHRVNDWDEEAERFPGASPSRDHKGCTPASECHRLFLMLEKVQWLAVRPKDAHAGRMELARAGKVRNGAPQLVAGVDLD